jgi:poly(A) polymerase
VAGEADLKARILRTIGVPTERFEEDHLRLLRAIRLAVQLDFQIEPGTFAALQRNARKILAVSPERIREELLKLFRPPHAARGLDLLRQSDLLIHILPEISATIECEQSPDYHPEGSVYNHLLEMLSRLPPNAPAPLPWAVLLHDVAKPRTYTKDSATGAIHFYGHERLGADMAKAILERLRFPRKEIDEIVSCVKHHMQFKDVRKMRKATVRRLLMRPTFPIELELHRLDCLGSHQQLDHYEFLVEENEALARQPEVKPHWVTGSDLIRFGMPPGPSMGKLLTQIRDKQLEGDFRSSEEALAWAKEQIEKALQNSGE